MPEYTTRAYDPLTTPEALALARTGAVRVAADLAGRTTLTSASSVGVIRAGDIELRVTPKVGIRRLLWLLGYSSDPAGWHDEQMVDLIAVDDLVPAIAVSFIAATNRALAAGILQGYRVMEEALPLLRGRLREADQIRSRLGVAVPLEIRYDDYTANIPENQILLTAALRLLRVPDVPAPVRTALRRLISLLTDVTPLIPGHVIPGTPDDRRTHRYQPALRLARIILAGRSLEQPVGPVTASGFLFDLNAVFENWLTTALRVALRPFGGVLRAQWPGHLDIGRRIRLRPDLVWERGGFPVAVIDAKYKALRPAAYPHADLYQMLAYCTVLGLRLGRLVYAAGEEQPLRHAIRRTNTTIETWTLDLSKPIRALLADVEGLAVSIVATSSSQIAPGASV
ncbi:MAG: McrC family protein [Chloroflexota bacterium]|nr:McrC family protein [Chloroflexota bacterium]